MLRCSRLQALQLTQDQEQTKVYLHTLSQGEGAVEILFLFSFENNKKNISRGGGSGYIYYKTVAKIQQLNDFPFVFSFVFLNFLLFFKIFTL